MMWIIQTIIDAIFWRRAARRRQALAEYYAKLDAITDARDLADAEEPKRPTTAEGWDEYEAAWDEWRYKHRHALAYLPPPKYKSFKEWVEKEESKYIKR